VNVGERAKEHRPHLLGRLCPGRLNWQWGTDPNVGFDDLVDRLGDELLIAGVDRFYEASERRFVGYFLGG
jgi:hypothetical protein